MTNRLLRDLQLLFQALPIFACLAISLLSKVIYLYLSNLQQQFEWSSELGPIYTAKNYTTTRERGDGATNVLVITTCTLTFTIWRQIEGTVQNKQQSYLLDRQSIITFYTHSAIRDNRILCVEDTVEHDKNRDILHPQLLNPLLTQSKY